MYQNVPLVSEESKRGTQRAQLHDQFDDNISSFFRIRQFEGCHIAQEIQHVNIMSTQLHMQIIAEIITSFLTFELSVITWSLFMLR